MEKNQELSASLEDYIEAILNLADEAGCARSKEVADALGVAKSSVTEALQLLRSKGLANHEPYGGITLTRRGQAAAREVVRKHEILRLFFMDVLGVEKETAQRAACRVEHALGSEIIGKLVRFIDYAAARNESGRDVAREFRQFCRKRPARGKE